MDKNKIPYGANYMTEVTDEELKEIVNRGRVRVHGIFAGRSLPLPKTIDLAECDNFLSAPSAYWLLEVLGTNITEETIVSWDLSDVREIWIPDTLSENIEGWLKMKYPHLTIRMRDPEWAV